MSSSYLNFNIESIISLKIQYVILRWERWHKMAIKNVVVCWFFSFLVIKHELNPWFNYLFTSKYPLSLALPLPTSMLIFSFWAFLSFFLFIYFYDFFLCRCFSWKMAQTLVVLRISYRDHYHRRKWKWSKTVCVTVMNDLHRNAMNMG